MRLRSRLGATARLHENGLHDRVDDLIVVRWKGTATPSSSSDSLGFAEDNSENGTVDWVVLAIEH